MHIKQAVITVLIVWALILVVAYGIAVVRHGLSVKGVIEQEWGISFAVAFIGFLFRAGALKGDTVERIEGAIRSSPNREGFNQADRQDATLGLAFGTVVMLAGLTVFGTSLATLYLFFPT